jgi:hypothetical protein
MELPFCDLRLYQNMDAITPAPCDAIRVMAARSTQGVPELLAVRRGFLTLLWRNIRPKTEMHEVGSTQADFK